MVELIFMNIKEIKKLEKLENFSEKLQKKLRKTIEKICCKKEKEEKNSFLVYF